MTDDDDMGAFWRDVKAHRREERARLGIPCPQCNVLQPKRTPTLLMPGQRCKVDGYRDTRMTP